LGIVGVADKVIRSYKPSGLGIVIAGVVEVEAGFDVVFLAGVFVADG